MGKKINIEFGRKISTGEGHAPTYEHKGPLGTTKITGSGMPNQTSLPAKPPESDGCFAASILIVLSLLGVGWGAGAWFKSFGPSSSAAVHSR